MLNEHVIGKIKRFKILSCRYRNCRKRFGLRVNLISAIYNFELRWFGKRSNQKRLLYGEIELDESYFGAKRQRGFHGKLKRGGGTLKQPVFGIFERDGRVYTEIVPDCKKGTLQALILGRVDVNSIIYSEAFVAIMA